MFNFTENKRTTQLYFTLRPGGVWKSRNLIECWFYFYTRTTSKRYRIFINEKSLLFTLFSDVWSQYVRVTKKNKITLNSLWRFWTVLTVKLTYNSTITIHIKNPCLLETMHSTQELYAKSTSLRKCVMPLLAC